jgi:hypothetical protein
MASPDGSVPPHWGRHSVVAIGLSEQSLPFRLLHIMEYLGVEYTVVQGIGRHIWKWAASINAKPRTGQAATKSEAVAEAERAIERALTSKKVRLVRPEQER